MSGYIRLISLLPVFLVFGFAIAADYCQIESCRTFQKGYHTMCWYQSPYHSATCGRILNTGISFGLQNKIVNTHNFLRQKVARGEEFNGMNGIRQPPARHMPNLEWDDELAEIAQRWANQCISGHDQCRDTESYQVGQNQANAWTTGGDLDVMQLVMNWYNEVVNYNSSTVSYYTSGLNTYGQATGHYTQMVWAATTKIGCGAVKSQYNEYTYIYLICNYGPSGNVYGHPVYQQRVYYYDSYGNVIG